MGSITVVATFGKFGKGQKADTRQGYDCTAPLAVALENKWLSRLSEAALTIVRSIKRRKGRDLVFGQRAGGFSGWSKAKSELDGRIATARKEAGIKKPMPAWRLHDLRRSFVTHLNEGGFAQPHVVEAIVNHVSGHLAGVAGIYNKALNLTERRQALELWGAHITALVEGRSSKIVPLKRAQ